jgi:c-di-GMP-binding flagellar brake protein YcgR
MEHKPSQQRASERQPIRLRVKYSNARALLSEYTTSLSRGGCSIRTGAVLPPDAVFVFELTVEGRETRCIEVEGRVAHSTPRRDGGYDVGIEYVSLSSPRRVAMTRFLDQVFAEQLANRQHARVPVNLVAEDAEDGSRYLLRDMSHGGVGVRLAEGRALPEGVWVGQQVEVIIVLDGDEPFVLPTNVVRLEDVTPTRKQAAIGLKFTELDEASQRVVLALLYLHRPQLIQLRFVR